MQLLMQNSVPGCARQCKRRTDVDDRLEEEVRTACEGRLPRWWSEEIDQLKVPSKKQGMTADVVTMNNEDVEHKKHEKFENSHAAQKKQW
jgi:hypothetical protein